MTDARPCPTTPGAGVPAPRGLALHEATYGYPPPGRTVAHGLSLALHPGERVALLGPNGGGKTTLFRALLGLLPLQRGQALLDGTALGRLGRREVARRVAYVPQRGDEVFPFPVREAVLLGRAPHHGALGGPGAADRRLVSAVLARLGIAHLADRACTQLSGGETALVRIARALAQQPSYLVLDEPTASLDFGNRVRLLELLDGLAAEGLGVLLSTHDPSQAAVWADRVALLGPTGLLALGPPTEVLTVEALRTLFGVEVVATAAPGGRGLLFAPRAQPRSRSPRRPACVAVVAPPGCGKTSTLLALAEALRRRGLTVGGVAQLAEREGTRNVGYRLLDLASEEARPFARRASAAGTGLGFAFDPAGWAWAATRIDAGRAGCDVLVVDELGRLEASGAGHLPALLTPHDAERARLWLLGVRADVADPIAARLGGYDRRVAPSNGAELASLADELAAAVGRASAAAAASTAAPAASRASTS